MSTKLQALSGIADIALNTPYFFALFSKLDAASVLSDVHLDLRAFRDLDPQVRTASERALVATSEADVVSLSLNLRSICYSYDWKSQIELAKTGISGLFAYTR